MNDPSSSDTVKCTLTLDIYRLFIDEAGIRMSNQSGYFTGLEYEIFQIFQPMNPAHIRFFLAFKGLAAPTFEETFDYCELGCGQGYNMLMFGALYPKGRFVGVDFAKSQIERAQALADEAGSDNVTFEAKSFEQFAAADGPAFDVISLHGIWSWVTRSVRSQVLDILKKRLKPGGVVYVGTNVMPGWSGVAPLQRHIVDLHRRNLLRGFDAAVQEFRAFTQTKPLSLTKSPTVESLVARGLKNLSYFAHEFMHDSWEPVYVQDLARDLAAAGLAYGNRGRSTDVLDCYLMTPEQRGYVGRIKDPLEQEFARDLMVNATFRTDYYVKDAALLSQHDQYVALASVPVALVLPERSNVNAITTVTGTHDLDEPVRGAIMERLLVGPALLHELLELPPCASAGLGATLQVFLALHSMSILEFGLGEAYDAEVMERAGQFNAAILLTSQRTPLEVEFAAPAIRAPLALDAKERVMLRAMLEGRDPTDELIRLIDTNGGAFKLDGRLVTSSGKKRQIVQDVIRAFKKDRMPLLQQLGMVGGASAPPKESRKRA
jgi:SAM-dependent methyltransferase